MRFVLICLMCFWLLSACSNKIEMVPVNLNDLEEITTDKEFPAVKILKSFEAAPCLEKNLNANVYQVMLLESRDTICVFEPCKKISIFKKKKGSETGFHIVLMKDEQFNDELYIPKSSNIFSDSKYVVANVKRLIY